jgi:hypothetical protein
MAKTTTRPIVRIHNAETNEIIDREMNDAEFAQWEIDQASQATAEAEAQAKATARAAILDRLGLTAEEAALLLS